MAIYTNKQGELRIYDGTSPTPYYISICFDGGDFSAPEGRQRPEEKLILHRGRADSSCPPVYIQGTDEPILEPLELSFSIRIQNSTTAHDKILAALSNISGTSPWTVGTDNWTSAKGTSTLTAGDGTTFTDPEFADSSKVAVNVEILWTLNSVAVGRRYEAVYFPPDQVSLEESEDGVTLNCTGLIYGAISQITSFTTGTAS